MPERTIPSYPNYPIIEVMSTKGKRSTEESASAAGGGDDSNIDVSLSETSSSEDEDEELVMEEGNKKSKRGSKKGSNKGRSTKKSSSSPFGKLGKWVRGHTYSNAKGPRVIGSDNVKFFGGLLKAGFVGVEIPKDTFMDMCKGAAKWAEKNGLVGSQIGGKARTSVGAGAKAFFALIEPIVPPMAVRLLFFCFFVIAFMDAIDPSIIKMRTYGEFTYTITAAVAFGVFSLLWLISDRKQTVVGSLMVLSLGGGLLAAGLVDHYGGWNASYDVLSDHLRYIKIVHLLYALGMGVTIMSMIQTMMNNKIKSS